MAFMDPHIVAKETSGITRKPRNKNIAEFMKLMQQGCAISGTKSEKTQCQMEKQT